MFSESWKFWYDFLSYFKFVSFLFNLDKNSFIMKKSGPATLRKFYLYAAFVIICICCDDLRILKRIVTVWNKLFQDEKTVMEEIIMIFYGLLGSFYLTCWTLLVTNSSGMLEVHNSILHFDRYIESTIS